MNSSKPVAGKYDPAKPLKCQIPCRRVLLRWSRYK